MIDNLKIELEKVVKERDELKVKIEKWEESSKGLNKLLNSQMSAKDKNGLGYGTQLDEMSNKSETDSEISISVFEVRSSDKEITPANNRFSKADSTDHLIKDCDFYAKKSPEPKLKTVVNTGQRVVKPVWDNAKRVNHQKFSNKLKYPQTRRTFVPKGVLTKTGLINPVRPNGKIAVHTVSTTSTARPVGTARPFAPKIAQTGSAIRPIYPRMDNVINAPCYCNEALTIHSKPAYVKTIKSVDGRKLKMTKNTKEFKIIKEQIKEVFRCNPQKLKLKKTEET
ncbi:hypothetical protein Tco_1500690 [Tanacetum coccineum]